MKNICGHPMTYGPGDCPWCQCENLRRDLEAGNREIKLLRDQVSELGWLVSNLRGQS